MAAVERRSRYKYVAGRAAQVGGGSLPPESLSCPACGGARSEYGGWLRIVARPLQPSTGLPMDPAALGKETLYSLGSSE